MSEQTQQVKTPEQSAVEDALGVYLRRNFEDWARERQQYEEGWLKDLRQYKGIYDPEIARNIHPKRSKAFVRLTRTKVKTMDARMMDIAFPGGTEKNYAIDPTPVPDIPDEKKAEIVATIMAERGTEPTEDEIRTIANDVAKKAAERMGTQIDDQLTEGKYVETIQDVMHSGHLFGTGVLKGPLVEKKVERHWTKTGGAHELLEREVRFPFFEFVPIWDYYPDMSATRHEDTEGEFQRHVMNKADLRALASRKSFDAEKIKEFLRAYPEGLAEQRFHEAELRNINAKKDGVNMLRRKYEVLEYWGWVSGYELANHGVELSDEEKDKEYEANVWIVGQTVIKAVINPTEQRMRPYHLYYFEKDETSIFGVSVPSVLRDTQQLFNAAIRATLDNAAISAGPQVEVNASLLADGESPTDLYPFRVWVRSGTGADAQAPLLRVYTLPSYTQELLALAEQFKQLGDEASTIPSYMHGEQDKGVGRTVGGLSMLMGAATITIKDSVRNFDNGITKPFIEGMYHWNMQFNDRDDIKGDYKVKARGSTALVAREIYTQQLDAFARATANPLDQPWVKRGELLRQMEKVRDLAGIVKSDEEFEQDMAAAMASMPGGPAQPDVPVVG